MEFKSFNKIPNINKLFYRITQKIHGTNGQILIRPFSEEDYSGVERGMIRQVDGLYYTVFAGSRNRWVSPDDDNYGFASWVESNCEDLIRILGVGRHYGEWAGPGIGPGEGLDKRTFVLFKRPLDTGKWLDSLKVVPLLGLGEVMEEGAIKKVIEFHLSGLKNRGSELVPGYMFPEGIVLELTASGERKSLFFKKVFDSEEVPWKKSKRKSTKSATSKSSPSVEHLLQPKRLEKLLMKDSTLRENYPQSLGQIVKEYVQDLSDEEQFDQQDRTLRKTLSKEVFKFVKLTISEY